MYKIIYLPDATFVVDGNSTPENIKVLIFRSFEKANNYIKKHTFAVSEYNKAWSGGCIYDVKPDHTLKEKIVLKCFLEPIEVKDD